MLMPIIYNFTLLNLKKTLGAALLVIVIIALGVSLDFPVDIAVPVIVGVALIILACLIPWISDKEQITMTSWGFQSQIYGDIYYDKITKFQLDHLGPNPVITFYFNEQKKITMNPGNFGKGKIDFQNFLSDFQSHAEIPLVNRNAILRESTWDAGWIMPTLVAVTVLSFIIIPLRPATAIMALPIVASAWLAYFSRTGKK